MPVAVCVLVVSTVDAMTISTIYLLQQAAALTQSIFVDDSFSICCFFEFWFCFSNFFRLCAARMAAAAYLFLVTYCRLFITH